MEQLQHVDTDSKANQIFESSFTITVITVPAAFWSFEKKF